MAGGAIVSGGSGGNPFKTGFVQRQYLWAFILTTSLFFLWGFAYGLLDVLNKHFQNTLHITKLQSTGLQVAYFGFGYFCFSPVAAEFMRRFGYKWTFIMGLSFYATGAILFWPVAHFSEGTKNPGAIFAGFVVCTAVIACGLATLEVGANSYVSIIPPVNVANFRLQFSQSFNGVASFTGPLIASKYFFSAENANSNKNVQYVYLAVAMLGVSVALAFAFSKIPEVSEAELQERADAQAAVAGEQADQGFWKTRAPFGFVTQFMYVGAQVTIGSFFLNYTHENAGLSDTRGSQLLSYGLICFTVGRFFGTFLMTFIDASLLLGIYAVICTILVVVISTIKGFGGVACLIVIMFFESVMYPVIFVMGTSNLGRHTRRGAGLLVMGVAGGAVFPPIQGAIADKAGTRTSYWVALPAFIEIAVFAFWYWNKAGRPIGIQKEVALAVQEEQGTYPVIPRVGAAHDGGEIDQKYDNKDEMEYVEKSRY